MHSSIHSLSYFMPRKLFLLYASKHCLTASCCFGEQQTYLFSEHFISFRSALAFDFLDVQVTTCRVRAISFCIEKSASGKVCFLFGGFMPSQGHGSRICKILRLELQRQVRLYNEYLCAHVQISSTLVNAAKKLRELWWHIYMSTEFLCKTELLRLRSLAPTRHQPPKWPIYNQEDLDLPQHVSKVLSLRPKFAVGPKRSPHDLLATVRQVSWRAPPEEQDRCLADGVDVLSRCKASLSTLPVKRVVDFMKEHSLCV
ncbi:hypothetical protein HPB51_021666 [Rhipicephalus microplus]|uniref:Tick transposon n=1 Tax=Rhipicephalus microplus TaxID=6941 RepID=A0A9J6E3U0_RHIMP|nr:hypothetical protein HPB51_021666 [Rhipicephalus microplus]